MPAVAYNPDDPLQQAFLGALGLGETGDVANSAAVGVGGEDLSSVIAGGNVDQYGFPQWQGEGNSHAAGTYQFEPSTWDSIASEFNLNFSNPGDQAEGAWQLAQETDPNLYADLQSGNYSSIQTALKNVWPSVTGNGAAPQGLAADIAANVGTNSGAETAQTASNNASGASGLPQVQGGVGAFIAQLGNLLTGNVGGGTSSPGEQVASGGLFPRIALIVIGGIVIFVALWMLLASTGAVPGPKQIATSLF